MAEIKEPYERYLAEEAAIKIPNVNLADRGYFHLCVLQAALAWARHPKTSFRIGRGKHFFVLHFEGPIETKSVVMFSFRSAVETGEYIFTSLNPAKLPQGLSPSARSALTRLRELYEAALPQCYLEDGMVTVVIRKNPPIDFLPIVDEARRVLDDGNQEFAPVDLSHVVPPTEKAALFVGKTTVTPSPKRRIRQVPQPVVRQEVHFEDDGEDQDRGNFLAAQSHRHEEPEEPKRPKKAARNRTAERKVAKRPAPARNNRGGTAKKPSKPAKPSKSAKSTKSLGRGGKRRAG